MPLPFSFSTQRQQSDGDFVAGSSGSAVLEMVMQQPPARVSTEPLASVALPALSSSVALGSSLGTDTFLGAMASSSALPLQLPPAPSPNQRSLPAPLPQRLPTLVADALTLPPPQPVPQAPSTPLLSPLGQPEWAMQMEQLRDDIFGIAMNLSAMRDRLDRLDQRGPQASAVGLATLRGEIEAWLHSHLNSAVEQCMHRMMNRMAASAPAVPPPAADAAAT